MNKILLLVLTVLFCIDTNAQYNWIQKPDYGGQARWGAVGFGIGDKGYVGLGLPSDFFWNEGKDFWQYDPATNAWTQVATFAGSKRRGATAFVINNKAYVTAGANDGDLVSDLWEYDPVANSWSPKANFPGPARWYTASFVVNGKAYVGTGSDGAGGLFKDMWEYDPATDTWTSKADVPGTGRAFAIAFGIGDKGYMGGGSGSGSGNDFWEYDPVTDTWTQKGNATNGYISGGAVFTLNNKGYVLDASQRFLWEYNPVTDLWSRSVDFPGAARNSEVGFSAGNTGYVGLGLTGGNFTKDIWAFAPCTSAGDPSVFGENTWNIYAWNSGGATLNNDAWNSNYAGYYTDATVNFNTKDTWPETASPSNASGYQGCIVNPDNHSWSAKRKGFPCGLFTISVSEHDDAGQLFVNGVKVWEHNSCCDVHNNVWKGGFGPETTIEFRVTEGGGASFGKLSIAPAVPVITANGLTNLCLGGTVTLSSDVAAGNQWYKDDVLIDGATAQTYTVTETGSYTTKIVVPDCGTFVSAPMAVTVATQPPPGDPSLFGDNTWIVSAYKSGDGTIAGTSWQNNYSGFYTDNTVSFNTQNKWNTLQSPSAAANYQGCPVDNDNHSWSAKRKGYLCGNYVLRIPEHDDAVQLFINGVKVFEHDAGNDGHDSVWLGQLDETSEIEFRGTEGSGGSYAKLDLVDARPVITSPNGITSICPGYAVTLIASPGSGYIWSTGETTQSITVSQEGDYTVQEPDNCGNLIQSLPFTLTIQPLAKPLVSIYSALNICDNGYGVATILVDNYNSTLTYVPSSETIKLVYDPYFSTAYAGTYAITAKDVLGCSSPASDSFTVIAPPGDPGVFGDNAWNVYGFDNGTNFSQNRPWTRYITDTIYGYGDVDTYHGYYVENNLSFDTRDRWDIYSNPSAANGFIGCYYYSWPHSWTAKRKGFACGNYNINIPGHEDGAELWVNGVKVWEHDGCCDSHDSVWQGALGPESRIEFRVKEGDISYYEGFGAIDIQLVNNNIAAPTITPAGPVNICSSSPVTLTSSVASGNLWSNGKTTQSIIVNTTGNYSVTAIEGCTAQSNVVTVNVTAAKTWYRDADADGYGNPGVSVQACTKPTGYVANKQDCDDTKATVRPGATEICDGIDNDCDGLTDEGFTKTAYYKDVDGDSYGDPNTLLRACSKPAGYVTNKRDCNDADAAIHPGAIDICDGIDNDCDGVIDEDCRSISIADASVTEGNTGQKNLRFTFSLNKVIAKQSITVNYTTQNGTATAGTDYVAKSGSVTFAAGVKQAYVNIAIKGDRQVEPNETFKVVLSNPVNAVIADGEATGTIINDDGAAIASESIALMPIVSSGTSVRLAPNPAFNTAKVLLQGYTGIVTINIMSLEGKQLLQRKVQAASAKLPQESIDVSRLAAGVYMVTIIDEHGNIKTERLVIQR